jgi:hypothetical protein
MFCPNCGRDMRDGEQFCTGCGMRLNNGPNHGMPPSYSAAPMYDSQNQYNGPDQPVAPSKAIPLLMGLLFGLFGVLLAVLTYNGNYGKYTKNPTENALLWSVIGLLIQLPIILALYFLVIMPMISSLFSM